MVVILLISAGNVLSILSAAPFSGINSIISWDLGVKTMVAGGVTCKVTDSP